MTWFALYLAGGLFCAELAWRSFRGTGHNIRSGSYVSIIVWWPIMLPVAVFMAVSSRLRSRSTGPRRPRRPRK